MATLTTTPGVAAPARPMTREEKRVILASSLGTVFEWYDFYLYGSLATIIGAQFFSAFDVNTRNIFALLAFAAGFLVRPFGALVFGRIGDLVGRKYTFLVTILIMGVSTFCVGLLPSYAQIGWIAPVVLIVLRMLQGWRSAASTAARRCTWPSTLPWDAAASTRPGSRPLLRWACSYRWLSFCPCACGWARRASRRVRVTRSPAGASRSCSRSFCSASRSGFVSR
jgi:hypothetical protein